VRDLCQSSRSDFSSILVSSPRTLVVHLGQGKVTVAKAGLHCENAGNSGKKVLFIASSNKLCL
jgi:hypothetical protein